MKRCALTLRPGVATLRNASLVCVSRPRCHSSVPRSLQPPRGPAARPKDGPVCGLLRSTSCKLRPRPILPPSIPLFQSCQIEAQQRRFFSTPAASPKHTAISSDEFARFMEEAKLNELPVGSSIGTAPPLFFYFFLNLKSNKKYIK